MKAFVFLPLLLMSIWISGCTKNEYVNPNQTIITDILSTDWKLITNNSGKQSYAVTINMPEINGNVNQNYGIVVSVSGDGDTYEAIPEVYNGRAYSYTHTAGSLTLEIQYADGTVDQNTPPANTVTVKIVLVESQE